MKILFVSLGCDKNLVDSERMLGSLTGAGYEFTDDETEAEVIVVNTCCFIGDAKEESINTLLEMAKQKETGKCRVLIAAGCLAQRYKDEVLKEIPEVDGILGTTSYDRIVQVVEDTLGGKTDAEFEDINILHEKEARRVLTTGGHYAYLKIAEGCNKHCTYCVIPSVRGKYRSVSMEALVEEAKELASGGVRELILVAQETTLYGVDLYGEKKLPALLRELAKIPGIHWIRMLYCYPEEITDELIETIKTEEKVCNYMDIPIQHASDRILSRMGRKTNRKEITERLTKLREEIPDMAIRTTMITGFPGETEEDVEELLDFVDEMEFERLGVFPYSQEEGTPAAVMEDQVSDEVKEERRDRVMELQQEISLDHGQDMIGRELEVFIEGQVADENAYVGRTYMDAPGVDGYIFVNTGLELMSGMFVRVRVTGALEYDLIGELCDENESA
ncbi:MULTISPECIES: 30S ribosomal protein S12 methylthiotransferase RimO [unclassified Candidatus Paralachnospira]|uniref:30S ribosomal protein S12 methylthiotransferase RimO n=1 Tax=unclassified Candidatus Paralachnospira TaxID=3099471 RepID=UPI003F901260